ncbi:MAG: DUF1398 domain-containing protein [Phycisphaerae bacterium]
MNSEQRNAAKECAGLSASGRIHFGELVTRLMKAGIERYHSDYSRMETTYYTPDGGSYVEPMVLDHAQIGETFSAAQVEAAVRQAQRGEIMYPQFTRQALAAGCVGYFVQITGKCVQYFGRNGETHTERFPSADRSNERSVAFKKVQTRPETERMTGHD